jgi:hypothetical protein
MTFERIVRPFQTVPFTPPPPAAVIEAEELEDVVLEFGRDGTVKTLQGSSSASSTSFTKTESKEVTRTKTERRVENPDDSSQYVMVEDTDKIEIESGKQDTYQYQVLEFEKQENNNP